MPTSGIYAFTVHGRVKGFGVNDKIILPPGIGAGVSPWSLLPNTSRCMHLRGNGGSVVSVDEIRAALAGVHFALSIQRRILDVDGIILRITKWDIDNY